LGENNLGEDRGQEGPESVTSHGLEAGALRLVLKRVQETLFEPQIIYGIEYLGDGDEQQGPLCLLGGDGFDAFQNDAHVQSQLEHKGTCN